MADSHMYPIWTHNFIKIGQALSQEFGNKNNHTKILYIRYKFAKAQKQTDRKAINRISLIVSQCFK